MITEEETGIPPIAVHFGNKQTYVFSTKDGSIVQDSQLNRASRTVFSWDGKQRQFAANAVSITCPFEATTVRNIPEKLSTDEELFKIKLKEGEEIGVTSVESLAYYIDWLISRENEKGEITKPNSIGVVIPKYWSDVQKQRLIEAAELSGVKVVPVISTTAHVYDYMCRCPFNEGETKYIALVDAGSTGFEVSYWKIEGKRAELIVYRYLDIGGDDLSNIFANRLLKDFTEGQFSDEIKEFCRKNIIENDNPRTKRIFLDEVIKKKESLIQTSKIRFDVTAFTQIELKRDLSYDDFSDIPSINGIVFDIVSTFLDTTMKGFYEKCPEMKDQEVAFIEKEGGNGLFIWTKEMLECYLSQETSSFLPATEFLAEGAAFYLKKQNNIEVIDEIHPYNYELRDNIVLATKNKDVFFNHDPIYTDDEGFELIYQKETYVLDNIHICEIKDKDTPIEGFPTFDAFQKLEIDDKFIEKRIIDSSKDLMNQYQINYRKLKNEDLEILKIGECLNDYQGICYQIPKLLRETLYREYKTEFNTIKNEGLEKYETISMSNSITEIQNSEEELKAKITEQWVNVFSKKIEAYQQTETSDQTKNIQKLSTNKEILEKQFAKFKSMFNESICCRKLLFKLNMEIHNLKYSEEYLHNDMHLEGPMEVLLEEQ